LYKYSHRCTCRTGAVFGFLDGGGGNGREERCTGEVVPGVPFSQRGRGLGSGHFTVFVNSEREQRCQRRYPDELEDDIIIFFESAPLLLFTAPV